jgi:hypothetical protein
MKWFIMMICTQLCLSALSDDMYRDFTDTQGRKIQAKLVSFDSKSGKVTIERNNHRKVTVSPTIFDDSDQAYIQQWVKGFLLSNKTNFSIKIDEEESKLSEFEKVVKNGSMRGDYTRFSTTQLTVNIKNKTDYDFGLTRLEYCLFIERKGYGKYEDQRYCETGSLTSSELNAQKNCLFKTDEIRINEHYTGEGDENTTTGIIDYYKKKSFIEKVIGVTFRLYIDSDDATDQFLEFSHPSSFKTNYHWNEFRLRGEKEKIGL